MSDVVVVGDVMLDIVVRPHGLLLPGTDRAADIAIGGGGSAANIACWLAACGVSVTLAARVGDSDHAAQVAELAGCGVSARLGRDAARPTGRVVALVDADGERSFYTDRGANAGLCAADLPPSLLDGARALHVSGHVLVGSDAAGPLMREARLRGVAVSADAGSAGWIGDDPDRFLDRIDACATCFANAREAALLWPDRAPTLPNGVVVVTRGAAGAIAFQRNSCVGVAAARGPVTDTVGAGDAFVAGFLAAQIVGCDLHIRLERAVATAAQAVATAGGRPTPAY